MHWRISGLTNEMNSILGEEMSVKTVAKWFRLLEREGIHYISRTEDTGEKVFDDLDLQIAIFIKQKRNDNRVLAAIFNDIKENIETRPFPVSGLSEEVETSTETDFPKEQLINELKQAFAEVAATELTSLKQQYETQLKQLPLPAEKEDWRERKFQEMVLRKRIEYLLEKEALLFWHAKPSRERMRRVGWFRKEEDWEKRDLFIRDYVFEHFEERLRKEMIDWDSKSDF